MKILHLLELGTTERLVHPEDFDEITLESPAISIFTDFKENRPLVIEANILAVQAEYLMKKAHVRLKIVVDNEGKLLGTVNLTQLGSQNILIHQQKGLDRDDILVKHLMTPRFDLKAIDYNEMKGATVIDIIETLKNIGVQHCLVVESKEHQIRGIISTSDIARRLHIPLDIESKATSFSDVFNVINH